MESSSSAREPDTVNDLRAAAIPAATASVDLRGVWFLSNPNVWLSEYGAPFPDGYVRSQIPPSTYFGPIHDFAIVRAREGDYTAVLVESRTHYDEMVWVNVRSDNSHFAHRAPSPEVDDWHGAGLDGPGYGWVYLRQLGCSSAK